MCHKLTELQFLVILYIWMNSYMETFNQSFRKISEELYLIPIEKFLTLTALTKTGANVIKLYLSLICYFLFVIPT
jgi:hypothetical protein